MNANVLSIYICMLGETVYTVYAWCGIKEKCHICFILKSGNAFNHCELKLQKVYMFNLWLRDFIFKTITTNTECSTVKQA